MQDENYMKEALACARRGWGRTHPNPMVGAVLVESGQIVARGWHEAAGREHAEVACLKALGRRPAEGATLYVTLEPCSTQGRTPACTQALLASGVGRVVVGCQDPNPAHAGRGLALLRQAGVEVVEGVLREACEDLNFIFNHWVVQQRPCVAVKWAATLDGYVATRTGASQWITGEVAREDVMRWRHLFPAIVVGAGTVFADNPSLTARIPDQPVECPRRFIVDSQLRLLESAKSFKVFTDEHAAQTCWVTTRQAPKDLPQGVCVWTLPSQEDGRVDLRAFVDRCGQEGIVGLFVEGGPTLHSAFLKTTGWDYGFAYQAPCLLGDAQAKPLLTGFAPSLPSQAFRFKKPIVTCLGSDLLLRGPIQ